MRKCVISEEYNAKRGSEPSKTFDFRFGFSLNFHVFSEPPSRSHFWRVQAPTYPQKCVFGPIFDFPGIRKSADTGRCQAFQIREASISEAPPSEACPPYLPASPRGIKMASKIASLRLFLASNFGIIFGMRFFFYFFLNF